MANTHLSLLLRLINSASEVDPLLKRGLTYSQIAELIRKAVDDGLILKSESELIVTPAGLDLMRIDESSGKERKDGGWISPEVESKIAPIALDDVYLPHARIVFD